LRVDEDVQAAVPFIDELNGVGDGFYATGRSVFGLFGIFLESLVKQNVSRKAKASPEKIQSR